MGIIIDLSKPNTDVEDVQTVFDEQVDDKVLESLYEICESIRSVLEYGDANVLVGEVDTVDEFYERLQAFRQQQVSNPQLDHMFSESLAILRYVLIGDDRREALAAQLLS